MTTNKTRTEKVLSELSNERWAAMSPTGRANCRRSYRWMRRDGVDRRHAQVMVDWLTLAGETAGRQAVAL